MLKGLFFLAVGLISVLVARKIATGKKEVAKVGIVVNFDNRHRALPGWEKGQDESQKEESEGFFLEDIPSTPESLPGE